VKEKKMSINPSSKFGFGVALDCLPSGGNRGDPGSPWRLYDDGGTHDGLGIVESGHWDDPHLLLVVRESLSESEAWTPKAIRPEQMAHVAEWTARIEAYLDRWNMRSWVSEGFEKPGFIHAPYFP
jgi:hypothetical protein